MTQQSRSESTLDPETFAKRLEEYKELSHECRYRDVLMTQEFSLSMIGAGIAITAYDTLSDSWVIQVAGMLFLAILTIHLRNTNEDRKRAYEIRRDMAADDLRFQPFHKSPRGKDRPSGPDLMVWFSGLATIAWAVWFVYSISKLF